MAQISFTKNHLQEAVFRNLFSMLLTMKTQIFEQAQAQLGYNLRRTNIFTNNETREAVEMPTDFCEKLFTFTHYSDAQVFETLRMNEMFWCLLSQFLYDKSERNNKYLDICFAISSTN